MVATTYISLLFYRWWCCGIKSCVYMHRSENIDPARYSYQPHVVIDCINAIEWSLKLAHVGYTLNGSDAGSLTFVNPSE